MKISRRMAYALVLTYYHTFIVVYSWGVGYIDVIISTLAITASSYFLLLRFSAKIGAFVSFDYKDLAASVFLYTFVSFYIAGMALVFSGKPVDFLHALLTITPITVWTIIWTDYYLQKMKGKM